LLPLESGGFEDRSVVMSKTVLVLFAVSVGLGLLSLHLVNQMRAGNATIAELQAQVAKLESERQRDPPAPAQEPTPAPTATWQVEQVAPAPATPNKETSKATAASSAPPAEPMIAAAPSVEDRLGMLRDSRERQRQLMQDPEYREAMRVQQRANVGRQYPGVGRELGLTPEQTEQLFDVLAEQQVRANEQAQLLWESDDGDPAAMQQRQQKMQQQWMDVQKKNEAELAAHLGADKVQAWKEYQSTLPARYQAEQLRTTLAGRGVALDDDASRAIVKAYAEAQKAEMQEYANMSRTNAAPGKVAALTMVTPRGFVGPTAPQEVYDRQLEFAKKRHQRVLDALTPYLTYEQRETLQKEQEAELKMQEAQIRMMRAQSKIDGNNGNTNRGWVSNSVQGIIVPSQ
jgi:hypothetical protein